MFIKEYDKNGILTYIVDKRTGKGYKVKKGIKERELNDFLIKLSNTQILEDISKKRINRIPIIRIKNIKGLSYVLIVSYTLLVVCNLVLLASTPLPDVDIKKSSPIDLLMVTAVLVLGIYFIHELSHIAVARFQGIMIRKISFKLKYYMLPAFYTQTFPTSNNLVKTNIAFVGLVADQFLFLVYFLLYIQYRTSSLLILLSLHIIILLNNYNPLIKSDFAQVIMLFFNKSHFRDDAFSYSKRFILYKEKETISNKKKLVYLLYSIVFVFFIIFTFYELIHLFFFQ